MTEEVKAYTVWQWECPCGYVNYRGDADPEGLDECDDCDLEVQVTLP